jgi:tRNA splicing endonuclease
MPGKRYNEKAVLSMLLELYELTKNQSELRMSWFLRDKKISSAFGTVLIQERLLVKISKNVYKWNTGLPNINTAIKTIKLVRDTHSVHIQTYKNKVAEAEALEKQKLEEQAILDAIQQEVVEEKILLEQQELENENRSASAKFEEDMQFVEEQRKLFDQASIENVVFNNGDIKQQSNEEELKSKFDLRNNKPKTKIEKQVSKQTKERKISIFWGAILIKW